MAGSAIISAVMNPTLSPIWFRLLVVSLFPILPNTHIRAAEGAASTTGSTNWTASQDHKNMMGQLGIKALRPGPSGRPGATNSANYDPAKANPFPDLPDPLTLKNGKKVSTADTWWKERRPEIVEDFEREVFGRVPKNVPKVAWTVVSNVTHGLVGKLPANGKQLVGHVDNSGYPEISVDIRMTLVTPVAAKGPVPVLLMFGGFGGNGMPRPAGSRILEGRSRIPLPPNNCSVRAGDTQLLTPVAFRRTMGQA
ncbi:MAG: lipolytic enzyme family [Verrucomicrobiales bacterium]|nr:lipolytic enzyme family [Verrucomicrobiales bacterium]